MRQPLEGIRVVELGMFHAGPGGAAILGDLGAEVIKIEQPGVGDQIRRQKRIGSIPFELPGGRTIFCEAANRNKKGVTIDLTKEKGQEIAHRLVGKSDVFLTNMRRQAVEKMRMNYPVLRQVNPRLIYASVSAFGPEGPYGDRGGFDYQGQGMSGLMYSMGEPGPTPLACQFGIVDQATAIMASHEVLTALYMRERTGIGQEVHVSILSSAMFLLYMNVLIAQVAGIDVPRHQRATEHPMRNYYRCGDDRWLIMTLTPPERHWPPLCRALGHPEWEKDPRYDTDDKRFERAGELNAMFDQVLATKSRDEWLRIFTEHDLFCCPIYKLTDLVNDPQIMQNGYIVDFDHPTLGKIRIPGYPIHFSEAQAGTRSAAPELGEHTDEVLREIAGCTDQEIAQLRAEKVV